MHFKTGLIWTLLPRSSIGSPFASSVFSDFHLRQRTDKPLTSFGSPVLKMLCFSIDFFRELETRE